MAQQHDDHEHHEDDRPSGQTRRNFLYSLSMAGVVALAGCGTTATATVAPQATTASAAANAPQAATTASTVPAATTRAATTAATAASGSTGTPASNTAVVPLATCVLTPDETEGPYYFNAAQVRRDITEGKAGTPLQLTFTVVNLSNGCQPIRDALVDIWHCDATGNYSGFSGQTPGGGAAGQGQRQGGGPPPSGAPGQGGPQGGARATPDVATAEKFLRGIQSTDATGQATFDTIFPSWYQGRLTHIHFKVHLDDKTTFTSQFFMPTDVEQNVYANDAPYKTRGQNPTTLANDGVVRTEAERAKLLLTAQRNGATIGGNFVVGLKL